MMGIQGNESSFFTWDLKVFRSRLSEVSPKRTTDTRKILVLNGLIDVSCLVVVLCEKLMGVYTKSTVFQYSTCLQKTYLIYVHKQWFFRGFIVIFVGFEKHLLILQAAVSFGNLFSLHMLNKVVLTQCKITLNHFAEWVENINMTNVCIC